MARSISSAAKAFTEAKFFREAIQTGDYTEVSNQIEILLKEYHKSAAIRAVSIYGKHRLMIDQLIKPALRNMDYCTVEYYPR